MGSSLLARLRAMLENLTLTVLNAPPNVRGPVPTPPTSSTSSSSASPNYVKGERFYNVLFDLLSRGIFNIDNPLWSSQHNSGRWVRTATKKKPLKTIRAVKCYGFWWKRFILEFDLQIKLQNGSLPPKTAALDDSDRLHRLLLRRYLNPSPTAV